MAEVSVGVRHFALVTIGPHPRLLAPPQRYSTAVQRVMKLNKYVDHFRMESADNPFQANGELSQKADYIISHSTITRTEIHIEDPDTARDQVVQETVVQESSKTTEGSAPTTDGTPVHGTSKTGNRDAAASPQAVEVEVKKANAAAAEPQRAEEVKLKKKRNCCSIQ